MTKKPEYFYKVVSIKKVVDGDTVDAEVDTGFRHKCTERFRLTGIDTPERGEPGFKEATQYLAYLLECYEGNLFVESEKAGSLRRWLGTFYGKSAETGELHNLNIEMIDKGHALPFRR